METQNTRKLYVPTSELDSFKHRVKKVNKRADKLGCDNVEIVSVEKSVSVETMETREGVFSRDLSAVTITTPDIKINGYSLAGIVTRDSQDAIAINDRGLIDFTEYTNPDFRRCDHCGVRHLRNSIAVLQDEEKSEIVVGKTCLKDFMGVTPNAYYKFVTELDMIYADDEQDETSGFVLSYDLLTYMSKVCVVADKIGFVPMSSFEDMPTALTAERSQFDQADIEKAKEKAQSIIDFVNNEMEPTNDYSFNMKQVFKNKIFDAKKIGFVASAYSAFNKRNKDLETRDSKHLGNVGEKIKATVEILSMRRGEPFGYNSPAPYFIKMKDTDGNLISVSTTSAKFLDSVETGMTATIEAKIKKLNTYAEKDETVVSHIKLAK